MASSQGTQPSKMNKREATLAFILRFRFFISNKIVADVASKQQMTVLFASTIVTRISRHEELKKN
jgi:hypothetical protein